MSTDEDDVYDDDNAPSFHAHYTAEATNCPVKISVDHWDSATVTIGESPDWIDIEVDQATLRRLAVASKVALAEMTAWQPDPQNLGNLAWLAPPQRA
jgi:hypothetical protein